MCVCVWEERAKKCAVRVLCKARFKSPNQRAQCSKGAEKYKRYALVLLVMRRKRENTKLLEFERIYSSDEKRVSNLIFTIEKSSNGKREKRENIF